MSVYVPTYVWLFVPECVGMQLVCACAYARVVCIVYVYEGSVFLHVNKLDLQGLWSQALCWNPSSAIY